MGPEHSSLSYILCITFVIYDVEIQKPRIGYVCSLFSRDDLSCDQLRDLHIRLYGWGTGAPITEEGRGPL